MKIGLDSSVIIHLLVKAGVGHERSRACYESFLAVGAEFILTDQSILESFSVLSRSPEPVGMPPLEAERLLRENFAGALVAPLRPGISWDTIRLTVSRGFWGGRTYDAAIALATFEAGARILLTWNVRHFQSIAPAGLEVREP